MALLILFVVVPVVAAVAVIAFEQWRSPTVPAGYLTSELLRDGTPATATLLDWQTRGQSFLDQRPMVTFRVAVHDDEPAELTITQSVPRGVLHRMSRECAWTCGSRRTGARALWRASRRRGE